MLTGLFEYKKKYDFSVKLKKKNKRYDVFLVRFPSAFSTGLKEGDYAWGFYYKVRESRKAIIILHGLSMISLTEYFCRKFAENGFSSFILVMPYASSRIPKKRIFSKLPNNIDFVDGFKKGLIQSVIDVRKTIDFLMCENDSIGILGISLGATIAALVHCIDSRISSGAFIVGGGDIANMLWDSRDFTTRFYKRVLARKVTRQQLAERWKDIDPLTYAKKGLKVLMINARYDTSVRGIYSKKLWEALGKPEKHMLRCAHFIMFHVFFIKNLILSHFRKTLNNSK